MLPAMGSTADKHRQLLIRALAALQAAGVDEPLQEDISAALKRKRGGIGRKPRLDVDEIRRRRAVGDSFAAIAADMDATPQGVQQALVRADQPKNR